MRILGTIKAITPSYEKDPGPLVPSSDKTNLTITRSSDFSQAIEQSTAWPTPTRLLLLRACLESGAEAHDAWEEWSSLVDLDYLDYESCCLLPMLDKNLRAIGVTGHPWLGRIKGYRRYIWAKNRQLFVRFSQVIQHLRPIVGDDFLVIKGVALACGHYSDPGLRQTRDLDCMVRLESVPHVLTHFKNLGLKMPLWIDEERNRYGPDVEPRCRIDQIPTSFGTQYASRIRIAGQQSILTDDKLHIDLHWLLMPDLRGTAANELFWNSAVPMRLTDGSEVRTLQATDLLFHCSLHGVLRWRPSMRWIVDAVTLLRDSESIRWERLVDLAEQLRYTLRLGTALSYVASTFPRQTCIPEEVIQILLNRDHSAEEIREYQERMGLSPCREQHPPSALAPSALACYRRDHLHSIPGSWIQEIRSLINFLKVRWDLPNFWLLFVIGPFRAARRIYRQIFRASLVLRAAISLLPDI